MAAEQAALHDDPWFREQTVGVREFVEAIDRSAQEQPGKKYFHPRVQCQMCHKWTRTDNFVPHVAKEHTEEFASCSRVSEAYWMATAARCQSLLATTHAELNVLRDEMARASPTPSAAIAQLEKDKRALQLKVTRLLERLEEAQRTSAEFEVHAYRNYRLLQQAGPRRVLCEVAELHQTLHEQGVFTDPQNATVASLHLQTLKRMDPAVDATKGGEPTKLNASARALWFFLYNTCRGSAYRMLRKVHRAAPNLRDVKRQAGQRFVDLGTPRRYTDDAAAFYKNIGVDITTTVWQVCWDPVKLKAEAKWDPQTNKLIGHVKFDQQLHFTSKAEMDSFLDDHDLAGYVMPLVLCPLDSAIPSAICVVGLIPTDLKYTQRDLHRYLTETRQNLRASGFRRVLMGAADNAPQHGKEMMLTMNPGAFESERSPLQVALGSDPELDEILRRSVLTPWRATRGPPF
eukprot:6790797-Prymnesium_polylepis.4